MIISVASGKGGTGKTTIATSLTLALSKQHDIQFLDCDVEEPNAHIFLKPHIRKVEPASISVPRIDEEKCSYCGECAKICAFNALAVIKKNVLVFDQLCHGCGGCARFCPEKAITEVKRKIGVTESGEAFETIKFTHGRLNTGEAISPPLIDAVKKNIKPGMINIIDAPPGTSCPVVASVKDSDFCLLVTEPTPFGLNDLELAVQMLRKLHIPAGVVINRSDTGDNKVEEYCRKEKVPVLLRIPWSREVATLYAKGKPPVNHILAWKDMFIGLYETLMNQMNHGDGSNDSQKNCIQTKETKKNQKNLAPASGKINQQKNLLIDSGKMNHENRPHDSHVREIVIISGKGGTGKTSLTGSFAALSENAVFVDSDVDAANLSLILQVEEIESYEFRASKKAVINEEKCSNCGTCTEVCRFDTISGKPLVNPIYCEGCAVCSRACPESAITMEEVVSGQWFLSATPRGKLVHARLGVAEGNSGKLVTLLRNKAKEIAREESKNLIIIDGPPGIACPVIASLSGVSAALVVTEPTLTGIQDMTRILNVCTNFHVPVFVCINRFDLDSGNTQIIEDFCRENSIPVFGKIPFDRVVTDALVKKQPVVKHSPDSAVSSVIRQIWQKAERFTGQCLKNT